MAAVSLFWNTNMVAVTFCENAVLVRPALALEIISHYKIQTEKSKERIIWLRV